MRRKASISPAVSNRGRRLEHALLRHLHGLEKKKRRTFPVGSDLKTAREECKVLEARNIRKENFDIKVESDPPERLDDRKISTRFSPNQKRDESYGSGRAAPAMSSGY